MKPIYLLDIEGTTTPISFVYDVLFPYARQQLSRFLKDNWQDAAVQKEAKELAPDIDGPTRATEVALELMDADRKVGALKSLQGRIWEEGYRSGQIRSQLFTDTAPMLRARKAAGLRTYIYSSGSVLAQKLLFAHTPEGNLTGLLDGYFDTAVGAKVQSESYREIARQIGILPADGLFATDVLAEAEAARSAGWQAVIVKRPGNPPQPVHDFQEWTSFP